MSRPENLTSIITHEVGKRIVCGEYSPGNVFQASELGTQFNASRTAVREAIRSLNSKGLVSSRASVGCIVSKEKHWNLTDPDVLNWMLHIKGVCLPLIREFNDFRLAIEPTAARLAAERGDKANIELIKRSLKRMFDAQKGEDDSLDSDIAFHLAILQASDNRFIMNMEHAIKVALKISIRYTNHKKAVKVASAEDHAKIANAIFSGDAVASEASMRALLLEARTLMY